VLLGIVLAHFDSHIDQLATVSIWQSERQKWVRKPLRWHCSGV